MRRTLLGSALASACLVHAAQGQTYATYTLNPSADTDVKGNSGGVGICGSCTELSIRDHSTGEYRPAYRFSFSALPSGSRLVGASLRIWVTGAYNAPVSLYRITADWSEATANYSNTNGLSPDTTVQGSFTPNTAGRYYAVDLTSLVGQWLNGSVANYGVVMRSTDGTVGRFTSREWPTVAQRPELVMTVLPPPALTLSRSSVVISDPERGTVNPKRIPGAVLAHTLAVENRSSGYPDANTVVIAEPVPPGTSLFVGDLGVAGSGPVGFAQGAPSSGLTYTYSGLASTTDDLAFSSDYGVSYTYLPVPDAFGYDPNVTHVQVSLKGTFAGEAGAGFPKLTLSQRSKLR